MLTSGPNLGLLVNGALGEQYYDEFMRFLRGVDGLVMLSVADKDLRSPPASPAAGARYIVASSPTGAWAGRAMRVARYSGSAWEFFIPKKGWLAHVDDENAFYKFDGSAWVKVLGPAPAGWQDAAGSASRDTFDTATVTTEELAERLKALIDDLKSAGVLA